MGEFINKVAESGIVTLSLEGYYPDAEVVSFDMKDYLFMGLILKEKTFRIDLAAVDLSIYDQKYVALTCSADAVIPMWAYMLVSSLLQPIAKDVIFGTTSEVSQKILLQNIANINPAIYADQRVVIKGCGDLPMPEAAYVAATTILRPVAKSIMYGEPCSTVPVYKKPRAASIN